MTARTTFKPVTKSEPCAVCGGGHKCAVGGDGLLVCGRSSGDVDGFTHLGESPNDPQWNLYRGTNNMVAISAVRPARAPARPAINWQCEAEQYARHLDARARAGLAAALGLNVDDLDALALTGADDAGRFWTFPERDGAGRVVGVTRRFLDGSKKMIHGGSRGLTIPAGWRDRAGPLLLVEGASDVLALTACGFAAVGRPSNTGGVEHLAGLLADLSPDREVIVIGENDEKDSGLWPGRDGAIRTAAALAAKLARPVAWALTPDGAKDPRAWLHSQTGLFPGAGFLDALQKVVIGSPAMLDESPVPERDDDPHRLARLFVAGFRTAAGECTLARWQSQFYRWAAGSYARLPDETVRADLTTFVREQFERDYDATEGNDKRPAAVRPVRQALVSDVIGALHGMVAVPFGVNPPGWLDGTATASADTINTPTGIVNLAALVDGTADAVTAPTPRYFTTTKTGVGFDPKAAAPAEWLKFLNTLCPNDPDSVACLQQWFGYLLTADARQQKMLLLVGPTRSGKGTIAAVLRALLGEGTVAGPTLNSLASNFGLSPLLDRAVAIVDDARLSSRTDAATVAERLLTITGEGLIDVDRKHLPAVAGAKLGTRFVVISNELPKLGDASGALVGRMIVLRFTKSFFGVEDHGLKDRLLKELPGVMMWAIEGWKRLRERGRFIQPARAQELVDELHDLSSPVGAFARERCQTGPDRSVVVADLFEAWKRWCEATGKQQSGTVNSFGRDLRAVVPELEVKQPRGADGRQVRTYFGIKIRPPGDDAFDAGRIDPVCVSPAPLPDASDAVMEPDASGGAVRNGLTRTRHAHDTDGDTHENATNPGLTRMTRTTSHLSTCGEKEEGKEHREVASNKEPCVSCVSGVSEPADLARHLLAAGPVRERVLADQFRAAGYDLDALGRALSDARAAEGTDPAGYSVWSLPRGGA